MAVAMLLPSWDRDVGQRPQADGRVPVPEPRGRSQCPVKGQGLILVDGMNVDGERMLLRVGIGKASLLPPCSGS